MRITYRHERWRAIAAGIIESAGSTFLLLIAVRWFHAGAIAKGLIASGGSLGLMLSPLVVTRVAHLRWPANLAASRLAILGAIVLFVMALFPTLPVFTLGALLSMAAASSVVPLLTHIYQENYPAAMRGKLFSHSIMIRIGVAALFGKYAGDALGGHLEYYRQLLLVIAAAFLFAAWHLRCCPSTCISNADGTHPFRSFRFIREDQIFRRTLICWMLMGFANLMMNPMRIEMLANPRHGLQLSTADVVFFVGVLPNIARFCLSPVWAWLFDRINFFVLRVVLNLGFAIGILMFFTTNDRMGLWIGSIIYGISNGGGDIAWSLWVTKFAPAHRVADYMSVHTFLTGFRGVAAPLAAFQLVGHFSLGALGWASAGLILIASALLLPEIKFGKNARSGFALIEEGID